MKKKNTKRPRHLNAGYDSVARRKEKSAAFMRRLGKLEAARKIEAQSVAEYAEAKGLKLENPGKRPRRAARKNLRMVPAYEGGQKTFAKILADLMEKHLEAGHDAVKAGDLAMKDYRRMYKKNYDPKKIEIRAYRAYEPVSDGFKLYRFGDSKQGRDFRFYRKVKDKAMAEAWINDPMAKAIPNPGFLKKLGKAIRSFTAKPDIDRLFYDWDRVPPSFREQVLVHLGFSPRSAKTLAQREWSAIPKKTRKTMKQRIKGRADYDLVNNPKRRAKKAGRPHARRRPAKKRAAKKHPRRRNSSASARAVELYKKFHGKDADEIIEVLTQVRETSDYAGLGDLVRLRLKNGYNIDFPDRIEEEDLEAGDRVLLASDPGGRQLYVLGGDQNLEQLVTALGLDDSKRMVDLGEITHVEYFTQKSFDDFKPVTYFHKLGEESGVRPRLVYDSEAEQIHIVGGEYEIRPEGIVN